MKPNERAVHNGADDNASGVIAALHAAEILRDSLKKEKNHRSILVALFAAEELGLGGSAHFVANTPVPKEKFVAMINLDMVGRLKDSDFAALGSDSAPEWAALLERSAKPLGLKVRSGGDGYGPSDQTSFYAAQVPVVHFFTGTHDAYHSPADDPATINAEGAARITRLTATVVEEIATGRTTPKYARMQAAPAAEGDSRGYGAYLGTVPDYRAMGATTGGAMISDVRPGGPAEAAGLKGGDTIIEIGGTKIDNLYDMTFALQDNKPGETVDVIVLRNNERVRLRATLGSRADRGKEAAPPPGHGETPKK